MISSKLMLPRPSERNSQNRRGSPNLVWPPNTPASVVVEAEFGATVDRLECPFRADNVESDFGGMYFQGKADARLLELIEDRIPPLREIGVAVFDLRVAYGREAVEQGPDFRTGEAIDDL